MPLPPRTPWQLSTEGQAHRATAEHGSWRAAVWGTGMFWFSGFERSGTNDTFLDTSSVLIFKNPCDFFFFFLDETEMGYLFRMKCQRRKK